MTFKSAKELENYILSHSKVAIEQARERVYDIIAKFLLRFYSEFEPSLYERTYQLLCSLVKTQATPTKNGWIAEVYFDVNSLDYSMKTLKNIGSWRNSYKQGNWSDENDAWVLKTAMTGDYPHGGYSGASGNTQIWTESMKVFNQDAIEILKQELINAGIPVK